MPMDFKAVTSSLLSAFEQDHVSYALIGGFAVSLGVINELLSIWTFW